MKRITTLWLIALSTLLLFAADLTYTYTRTLNDSEQRGIKYAAAQFNAQQKAADTNWVNITPRQYLTARINDLIDGYNRGADQATGEELKAELTRIRDAYIGGDATKRTNILAAAQ